jgi:hypothetical protein
MAGIVKNPAYSKNLTFTNIDELLDILSHK